ncbi:hypothetical protein AB0F72_41155 [Actinoplanes sp. NPDC023936]|uniref:hypothetical protein n=1 Tax=Actinoplanes sp. NPDC023936 TaxID=3154910 RepID=UPI0033FBCBAA
MPDERPWWHNGTALWPMALSSMGVFISRVLDDPYDNFGGPLLHFIMLGGSGALFATTIALLVIRRRTRIGKE